MFPKKNYENIIYFFSFIFIIFFYLYSKNSLFSHWSDILDQDVTLIYRSVNGGTYYERDYADASYYGGYWHPHCASIVDTSVGAMGVGDTVRYQAYVRNRGGGSTVYFHRELGGVSGSPYIIAQEIVN